MYAADFNENDLDERNLIKSSIGYLFPAINNVLKIAFLWFSVELENFLVKSSKFM